MIRDLLYNNDIYLDFSQEGHSFDDSGWGGKRPFLTDFVDEHKPKLILEVGTWKGQSALTMARAMKKNNIKGELVCIDTWLGSSEHWDRSGNKNMVKNRYGSLNHKHGYPTLYYQFLANVCHEHLQDYITPLPNTSLNAATILKKHKIKADAIYIDAGHSYEEVYMDLLAYYPLMTENGLKKGLFFGDDYGSFDGVKRAVDQFANDARLRVQDDKNNIWRLVKK